MPANLSAPKKRWLWRAAAAAVLAGLSAWTLRATLAAPRISNLRYSLAGYTDEGESLLHGAPLLNSFRMPLSGVLSALLFNHLAVVPEATAPVFGWLAALLAFGLCLLLEPGGIELGVTSLIVIIASTGAHVGFQYPETAYAVLVLTAGVALAWRAREASLQTSLFLALAIGATLLYRSALVFFPPVLAVFEWLAWRRGSLRRYWKQLTCLCAAPYLVLLPWIALNWVVHHRFMPLENGAANLNIATGALGLVQTAEGDWRALAGDEPALRRPASALIWAARAIGRHPVQYAGSVARRLAAVFSLHPLLFLLAFLGAWTQRASRPYQALSLLCAYFLAAHCAMSVLPRYFIPLWPLLAVLAAAAILPHLPRASSWPRELQSRLALGAFKIWLGAIFAFGLFTLVLVAAYARGALRRSPGSKEALSEALAAGKPDAWLLYCKAKRELEDGELDWAHHDLDLASALEPQFPDSVILADWVLALQGRPERLLSRRDLPPEADGARALNLTARIYQAHADLRLGRPDKALERLNSARELHQSGIVVYGAPTDAAQAVLNRMRSADSEFFAAAFGLIESRPIPERIVFLRELTLVIPQDPRPWIALAVLQAQRRDFASASRSAERAETLKPPQKQWLELAGLYETLHRFDRARAILGNLAQTSPDRPGLLLRKAHVEILLGMREAASRTLAAAASLHPSPDGLRALSALYRNLKMYGPAAAALEPVASDRPLAAQLWQAQAAASLDSGDRTAALKSLARSAALARDGESLGGIAALYEKLGEDGAALSLIRHATEQNPRQARLWAQRADLEARTGDARAARESLATARTGGPDGDDLERMSAVYRRLGDFGGALDALEAAERGKIPTAESQLRLASAAQEAGQGQRALRALARAGALQPTDSQWRRIALLYQDLKKPDRALPILGTLIARNPKNAGLLSDRGLCRYLAGSVPLAIEDLEAAIRADPAHLPAYLTLGTIYTAEKEKKLALKIYDLALTTPEKPASKQVRTLIAQSRKDLLRSSQ